MVIDRSASGEHGAGLPPAPSLLPVYLAHATTHLSIGLFPAVLFMLRETFSASYRTLGGVFTSAMLAYGLLALPTGLILNHVSPLLVVRLVLVAGAAACLAIALAPNELAFAIAPIALGMPCGPYHTAGLTPVVVSACSPGGEQVATWTAVLAPASASDWAT